MDRMIVYPAAQPQETDILNSNRFAMVGLGAALSSIFGSNTLVDGLPCTPGSGLNVQIGQGAIYALAGIDATAYSSLAADTTDTIIKQGLTWGQTPLSTPAPGTVGYSIIYLIEAQQQDVDDTPVNLPYYNSSNQTPVFTSANSVRRSKCALQVKAGTAAASPVAPTADAGWTPLYTVTVPYGATQTTTGMIAVASGAPFITTKLGNFLQVYAGNPNGNVAGTAATPGTTAPSLVWDTVESTLWVCTTTGNAAAAVWSRQSLMQVYAGNPNTHVAGNAATAGGASPSMIWDVTNGVLWVCTTTGNAAGAVWTEVGIPMGAFPFWCGTSTGSANAQTVTPPASMQAFGVGAGVTFIAGYTNTSAATLTVGTFGTFQLRKDGPSGLAPLSGNEMIAGEVISGRYDGTYVQISSVSLGALAYENIGQGLEDDGVGNLRVKLADNSLRRTVNGIQENCQTTYLSGGTTVLTSTSNGGQYTANSASTVQIPASSALWNGWFAEFNALGGAITVTLTDGTNTIQGGTAGGSYTIAKGTSARVECDGAGNFPVMFQTPSPSASPAPQYITANTNLSAGNYSADTSAGSFTGTLSAAPTTGDIVMINDFAGTWAQNPLVINPNGKTIAGLSGNFNLDVAGASVSFEYKSNNWSIQ